MIHGTGAERATLSEAAERRQITALFYDLVGSTELVLRLDLEDMRDLQRSFHRACMSEVARFDGYLERTTGDGGSAYFGYPKAQEDASERAVRCGLAIIQSCQRLDRDLPTEVPKLSVRIGIATGEAVLRNLVDGTAEKGDEIISAAVNLASRLQGVAEPNSVLVSELTHQLTTGLFNYEATGPWVLKGFGQPQIAWKVTAARQVPDRLRATRPALTPIVGRDAELQLILSCWESAHTGHGQAVLLKGEAGIGKSRVIAAAREKLRKENCQRLTFQCAAYAHDASLHPIIAQLNLWISQTASTRDDGTERALRELLMQSGSYSDERVKLLARLLGIAKFDDSAQLHDSPDYVRRQTLECLLEHLRNLAAIRPLLLVFEDIHWMDPTTEELFGRLIRRLSEYSILLLASFRPDFTPTFLEKSNVTLLQLDRLSESQSEHLMNLILGTRTLPDAVRQRILENTDGIPLFIEEMTKSVLARFEGVSPGDDKTLTEAAFSEGLVVNLQDFLSARLDQLGAAKEIAQVASVLGRSFSIGILAQMLRRDPGSVEALASEMVDLSLADRRIRGSTVTYNFRHSLIQEAAYESLLKRRRRTLHSRAAEVLRSSQERGEMVPAEVLAHHYERGGRPEEAIAQLRIAGRLAAERSANREVSALLTRAMRLVEGLPTSLERDQNELDLIIELGSAWISLHGSGASLVQDLFQRGVSLSGRLPTSASHFAAMWGWWFTAPNFSEMRRRADHLLALTSKLDDVELRVQAHHCQWATLFHLGEQRRCLEHIDSGLHYYKERSYGAHKILYGGHDPKVCALGEKALCLWLLGYPETALVTCRESLALAEELGHVGSITHATDIEIMLHWYRRDPASVRNSGDKLLVLAQEHGLPDLQAKVQIMLGWADLQKGVEVESVKRIETAIESLRSTGTEEDMPVFSDILAEAHMSSGRLSTALDVLDKALEMSEHQGLRYWLAELLRRKAELLFDSEPGQTMVWRKLLEQAVSVAISQDVKTLLIRALTTWLNAERQIKPKAGTIADLSYRLKKACESLPEGQHSPDMRFAVKTLSAVGIKQ